MTPLIVSPADRPLHQNAPRLLFRRLVMTLAAAATALATITAPAAASKSSDDLAKFLAALAAVALIANALDDDGPSRPKPPRNRDLPKPRPGYGDDDFKLPRACAIEIDGSRQNRISYSERCLINHGYQYRLPQNCARNVTLYGRNDRLYSAKCLKEAGLDSGDWRGKRQGNRHRKH